MTCTNNINRLNTECRKPVHVKPKQFFKLLKRAIRNASTNEELKKLYLKAKDNKEHFTKTRGILIEEMIENKLKELKTHK